MPLVELNPEDISRKMANLTKTAFDATLDKISAVGLEYKAKLGSRTQHPGDRILITVEINGQYEPGEIRVKLQTPFLLPKSDPKKPDWD